MTLVGIVAASATAAVLAAKLNQMHRNGTHEQAITNCAILSKRASFPEVEFVKCLEVQLQKSLFEEK